MGEASRMGSILLISILGFNYLYWHFLQRKASERRKLWESLQEIGEYSAGNDWVLGQDRGYRTAKFELQWDYQFERVGPCHWDSQQKMNCSSDQDYIHPKMIAMSGPTLRTCLINLFNGRLSSASWPWNETRVLFLKRPREPNYSESTAYRTISISSHIEKRFERILNNRVKKFILEKNLIDPEQEGFIQNKNTKRSIFRLKIGFEKMKKSKLRAALINLDLEKAFDSVWHNGFLFKVWIAGIRGPLFKILQTFFKNLLVRTRLEGWLSHQVQPRQDVPEGNVLSLLLFNFYTAEMLTNTTNSSMQMTLKYFCALQWKALFIIEFYSGTSTSSKNGAGH